MVKIRENIPIRDLKREESGSKPGPVKSWVMSPEELEDYRARTGYKAPRNQDGKELSSPMQLESKPRIAAGEKKDGRVKEGPDKLEFLKMIAAGKTIGAAEKQFEMKLNALYYWIKKWDLVGITPGKARELLGIELKEEEVKAVVEVENVVPAPVENEAVMSLQTKITTLTEERDQWYRELCVSRIAFVHVERERDQARQACAELKEERNLLLQTLEQAATIKPDEDKCMVGTVVDNVNHPAHYTTGGIETIDFIQAKLTPEEFSGYCKGNALKYVSRANLESLQKADWYLNRLIEVAK